MNEDNLNIFDLNYMVPERLLLPFSLELKQQKQPGCHSYKGTLGKYQNWAQKKDDK